MPCTGHVIDLLFKLSADDIDCVRVKILKIVQVCGDFFHVFFTPMLRMLCQSLYFSGIFEKPFLGEEMFPLESKMAFQLLCDVLV